MQSQWEPWTCFSATRRPQSDTRIVLRAELHGLGVEIQGAGRFLRDRAAWYRTSGSGERRAAVRAALPARRTQPLKPISPPSYGSDLPNSLDALCQRLFTLEICYGYGHSLAQDIYLIQLTPKSCLDGCHYRKARLTKICGWKQEKGFPCFYGHVWIFCFDFNPECKEIWSGLKHGSKITVICSLNQLFLIHSGWLTWLVHKWVVDPFNRNFRVSFNWEIMLKLFWKGATGDHAPSGRRKVQPQSLLQFLQLSETCWESPCSLVSVIPVWLWVQQPYLTIWKQLSFFLEVKDWVCWAS